MGRPAIDLRGQRFGYVTVIKRAGDRDHNARWLCKCDCGTEFVTEGTKLRKGSTRSCGCKRNELIGVANSRHGDTETRLWRIWKGIHDRCARDNRYTRRGIRVCDEWNTYETFRDWALTNGYSDELTIDRINNDGDYEPNNCRWTDVTAQANNRRTNVLLVINNERHTIAEWSKRSGVKYETIRSRIRRGLTGHRLIEPTRRKRG